MPLAVLAVVALADDASIGQGDYSSHHGVAPGVAFPAAGELQGAFHEIFIYFHNACAKLHK